MRYVLLSTLIFLASCSKEPDVEVAQNKLTLLASMDIKGVGSSYNNFTIEKLDGVPFNAIIIPSASPVVRIESSPLFELDSLNVLSQKVNIRYTEGSKTYIANNLTGDGYIICLRNRNSEINVNIRDGNGNIKPALKRNEDFEAKFRFTAVNQSAPFDTVRITNGKLIRNGYYYVY